MEIGLVKQIDIDAEMRQSYLSYAMSVIVARALPDARDGLKPVQRRILYAMYDMGMVADKPHRKSARVVGEVLGKYHPHGDSSVYDAMVRMAQDFSLRYVLVDGQGNFGSVDGDEAAAMRYTEARLSPMGLDLLTDIDKETVRFVSNFDDTLQEPLVLPAIVPNLLVNGSAGIAVGITTSIPPHNLREIIDALHHILDNWNRFSEINVDELIKFVQGPDFPTGGILFRYRNKGEGASDVITNAYATGRGRITVRAKAYIEQIERNKSRIIITELPYQVNKTNLLTRIAELHREGRLEGFTDLRDESDRTGTRIVIETTRNIEPKEALGQLFKLTPLESTFSVIMVALVNGEPRILTLKQALKVYLDHRLEIVRLRSEFDLLKAEERVHILEGLLVALNQLEAIIATIRKSRNADTARKNLQEQFKLSSEQAVAILDMPLRRLAQLERRKIQEEHDEKQKLITYLQKLLVRPDLQRQLIKEELRQVREKYGDARRTLIVDGDEDAILTADDLLPNEQVWVMVGEKGMVARTAAAEMVEIPVKPRELPLALMPALTQQLLYLFTADGYTINLPIHQLPAVAELGMGVQVSTLISLSPKQRIIAAWVRSAEATGYLFLTTLAGVVKRVRIEDLPVTLSEPIMVLNVPQNDALNWVRHTSGEDEVILATASGQLIRFKEEEVRPMGLSAGGVLGMKLSGETDGIIAMDGVLPDSYIWSITDNGLAKASPISQYPTQGRYGQGVINMRLPKEAAEVVAVVVAEESSELLVTTAIGGCYRLPLNTAAIGSRTVKPQMVLRIGERNRVSGAMRLMKMKVDTGAELLPKMPAQQLSLMK